MIVNAAESLAVMVKRESEQRIDELCCRERGREKMEGEGRMNVGSREGRMEEVWNKGVTDSAGGWGGGGSSWSPSVLQEHTLRHARARAHTHTYSSPHVPITPARASR